MTDLELPLISNHNNSSKEHLLSHLSNDCGAHGDEENEDGDNEQGISALKHRIKSHHMSSPIDDTAFAPDSSKKIDELFVSEEHDEQMAKAILRQPRFNLGPDRGHVLTNYPKYQHNYCPRYLYQHHHYPRPGSSLSRHPSLLKRQLLAMINSLITVGACVYAVYYFGDKFFSATMSLYKYMGMVMVGTVVWVIEMIIFIAKMNSTIEESANNAEREEIAREHQE